jgi:hypothetical protein
VELTYSNFRFKTQKPEELVEVGSKYFRVF